MTKYLPKTINVFVASKNRLAGMCDNREEIPATRLIESPEFHAASLQFWM